MVISVREVVLECECDFASVFDLLVHAPVKIGISIEDLITLADNILIIFPPEKLRKAVDVEVKRIIDRDLVKCFHVPVHLKSCSVQADWVLLQNLYITPTPTPTNDIPAAAIHPNCDSSELSTMQIFLSWSYIRLNLFQNKKILNKFEMNSNVLESYSSYVGPFKGDLDINGLNRNISRRDDNKFGLSSFNFLNLLRIIDDSTFSLSTLLCGATFLTFWIAGTHYYNFNDFKTRF